MVKIPLIKTPGLIANAAQRTASAVGQMASATAGPFASRFAMAGEHVGGVFDPATLRPPPPHAPKALDAALSAFDQPAIISEDVDPRPPLPYYTVVNWKGKVPEFYTHHTPVAPLMEILAQHGTVERQKDHHLFQLRDGRRIKFNFIAGDAGDVLKDIDLSLQGRKDEVTLPLARDFLAILVEHNAVGAAFKRNPHYEDEKAAYRRWHSDPTIADVPRVTLRNLLSGKWEWDVLIIPDFHEYWDELELIEELLERNPVDWIAMEMLRASFQPIIDRYLNAPGCTSHLEAVKRKLKVELMQNMDLLKKRPSLMSRALKMLRRPDQRAQAEFAKRPSGMEYLMQGVRGIRHDLKGWNTYLGDVGPTGPYFELMIQCRKRDMRLYGLNCEREYIMNNYSPRERAPWIMGAENRLWAERVPSARRGIMLIGEMHGKRFPGVRVPDYLADTQSDRRVVMVEFRK